MQSKFNQLEAIINRNTICKLFQCFRKGNIRYNRFINGIFFRFHLLWKKICENVFCFNRRNLHSIQFYLPQNVIMNSTSFHIMKFFGKVQILSIGYRSVANHQISPWWNSANYDNYFRRYLYLLQFHISVAHSKKWIIEMKQWIRMNHTQKETNLSIFVNKPFNMSFIFRYAHVLGQIDNL